MSGWALHPTPRPRDVAREQLRAVGLALRVPAAAAAVVVAVATLFITLEVVGEGGSIRFAPEEQMLPGVLGLLLPFAVWRGEERFGAAFLWTLPVERRRHALARVFAGWAWLMGAVALFVLWLLAAALLTGASVLGEETVRLLPASSLPATGSVDPAALRTALRAPQPLLWLVPFTAATAAYLLSSALALGIRHPLRWLAGTVLALFFVALALELAGDQRLRLAPSRLLHSLLYGPYGVDALFTARSESLRTEALLSTGERVVVWLGTPDPARWAAATLLWTGLGLAALWAAASRHRERRRG